MDRRVLAGVFAGGWVVVVTGPEQHAATVARLIEDEAICTDADVESLRFILGLANELDECDKRADRAEARADDLHSDLRHMRNRADELQRERDEARGSSQRWQDGCRAILDTASGFEQERNEARREAGQLRAALGVAYTAIERATFDAHDREWARDVMNQIRAALAGVQADNKDSA